MCFIIIFVDSATKLCFFRKTKPTPTNNHTPPARLFFRCGSKDPIFTKRKILYS